jgi:hypothetical protein
MKYYYSFLIFAAIVLLAGQFLIIKEAEEKHQAKKQYTQIERIITLSVESQNSYLFHSVLWLWLRVNNYFRPFFIL